MTTTISDLPKKLVGMILSRVPITSLGAVRSTCKRWNALSKDEIICKAEAKHQFLGFMMKKYKLCSVRFDLFDNEDEYVDPSIKEIGNTPLGQVKLFQVFQCDGLLLCVTELEDLVVWNPYLGQTRWIQPRNSYHSLDRYAIGFDNNRKHKILRFLDDPDSVCEYEIYDFSSNSWRVLDITPTCEIQFTQRGTSLKGNTYLIATEKIPWPEEEETEQIVPESVLICFDFTTESFGQFLPLPFAHYDDCTGAISSLGDEKLAALYQGLDSSEVEVEIWVTSMIEPHAVSWIPFLKVDMEPHFGFDFYVSGGSFFIDEEKKVAVVISYDASETTRYEDAAYIIGENGSYVPSLVQINQTAAGFKKGREEEEEASQPTNTKKKK
ncbi:putative F-box protein At3g20030, partial [Capsella rubella]|uniref:putative F-box protein At3g20030 n=1 Tax=Capsella rubella TaxID=81985 RepID=UPI000CD52F5F